MSTVCIDLAQQKDPREALTRALRRDPMKIVLIGANSELERIARESGHEVQVLPPGSPVPAGAESVHPR